MERSVAIGTNGDRPGEIEFLGYDCGLLPVAATCLDLHRDVAELARHVHSETRPHYEPVAAQFAALGSKHIPGVADAGGLLIVGRGDWRSVSDLETNAALIEGLHKDLGEGPALDTANNQQMVRVPDITADMRWPRFTDAAARHTPVRSLVCLPLYTHIHTWGSLMFLANQPNELDDDAEQAGTILATHAALTLEAMHHERHHRSALGSRDIIGQAKGMLMERFDVDAQEAFALLTRLAEESHRPVVVVAKEMLESKLGAKS